MQHIEVPRLGVESKLQMLAYTTATATLDPQLLSEARVKPKSSWILVRFVSIEPQ